MTEAPASTHDEAAEQVVEGEPVELAIVEASPIPAVGEWMAIREIAAQVCNTDFVPTGMRGRPEAVVAAILTGREMGLGPMASLQGIRIQDGKPAYDAELMRALVRRRGHTIRVIEKTHERCKLYGRRADNGEEAEVTWDLDDALRAELIDRIEDGRPIARSKNDYSMPWQKYPKRMLFARATSELVNDLFADVLVGGSYTPEELGASGWDDRAEEVAAREASLAEARGAISKAKAAGEITGRNMIDAAKALGLTGGWDTLSADELGRCLQKAREIASADDQGPPDGGGGSTDEVSSTAAGTGPDGDEPPPAPVDSPDAVEAASSGSQGDPTLMAEQTPSGLAYRIELFKQAKWEPEEGHGSGDPQEERRMLLGVAAEIVRDRSLTEPAARKVLGHGGRKNVAKALGEATLGDLRTAIEILEAHEPEATS